jgi:hypothetical protein
LSCSVVVPELQRSRESIKSTSACIGRTSLAGL